MESTTKPLSLYTCFIAATVCISGFLLGYHIAIISGALDFIATDFHFSLREESSFVGLTLLGAALGSFLGGYSTKKLGRKKVFWLTCVLLILGCSILLNTSSYFLLLTARVMQGIAIGLISVTAPLYLGEISPIAHRGKIVSSYQLMVSLGILTAYTVNDLFASTGNWQVMFLIGLIPLVLQVFCLFFIPESPYWFFQRNQVSQGDHALEKLGLPMVSEPVQPKEIKAHPKTLTSIVWIGMLLSIFQQITGINAIVCFSPRIFQGAGYTSLAAAMESTLILGIVTFISGIFSVWLLDRAGRRKLLLISVSGMTLSFLAFSLVDFYQVPFSAQMSLAFLVLYRICFALGLGPTTWVILSEIYPPQIRDKAMSRSLVANWLCIFSVVWSFPLLLSSIHISGVFGMYAFISFLALLFVIKYIPETKKKSFEEIFILFEKR